MIAKLYVPGILLILAGLLYSETSSAQKVTDSMVTVIDTTKRTAVVTEKKTDTLKKRGPAGKAAMRSAVLPGWGQAYNKKYWKIPVVYGVLAVPVATFSYNLKWYNKTRYAYTVKVNKDSANYGNIDPELQPLSNESLKLYRNEFRKNVDFSVLAFILLWGLNVVDAAVDGHLKDFNVNEDLSLKIKPGYSEMSNTTGLSLVLKIGKTQAERKSTGR